MYNLQNIQGKFNCCQHPNENREDDFSQKIRKGMVTLIILDIIFLLYGSIYFSLAEEYFRKAEMEKKE